MRTSRTLLFSLVLLLCLLVDAAGRDFYKILGISRNADEAAIKKAYRKGALKWHPDRVDDADREKANKKFSDIGAAYETLSDPDKRRMYDQVGEEGVRDAGPPPGHGDGGGQPGGGFHHGGSTFSFSSSSGGGHSDPFNIFSQFFGGQAGGGHGGGQGGGFGGFGGHPHHHHQQQQQHRPPQPDPFAAGAADMGDVIRLTRGSFDSTVGRSARGARVFILFFYSPAADAARIAAPSLAHLATALRGAVGVAVANCATPALRPVCDTYGVSGGETPVLKILHPGGSNDFALATLVDRVRRGEAPLKASAPLRAAAVAHISTGAVGVLPATRAALDKAARKCSVITGVGTRRTMAGCVVLFSSRGEVSPLFAALAQPHFGFNATAAAPKTSPPPPAFAFLHVHVPTEEGGVEGSKRVRDGADAAGAVDLGVRAAPALLVLHGSSLEDFRLGEPLLEGDIAAGRASGPDGAIRGRAVFKPASGSVGTATTADMAKWLTGHQRALAKALAAAAARPDARGEL